jgi:IS30 family transposase
MGLRSRDTELNVRDAITRTIITLPQELRRSLTWDQGAEMAQQDRLKIDAGVQVYFCDPQSPWQRGTNENTLLRRYFPKAPPLLPPSTPDRERRWDGKRRRRRLTSGYHE